MRFDPSFLDEIRARLPVSQVVSRRVKLKRQGREFVGLSPFKQEKTPSFTVNDKKGFYHCFASGEHGDIFTFLNKTEGLSFPESVERLAREAGLEMPERRPEDVERQARRATLYDVMEKAAVLFEARLAGREGQRARGYLDERGVSEAARKRFRIGFAPADKYHLKQILTAEGVGQDQLVETGMLIAGDDIPVSYDRFRDRIIFPITDLKDRVIAFGGRALDPGHPAKYLNSPETPLFHKGGILFNAAGAREAAYARQQVIVVEGYMDVIALAEAGIENAVAPLGTALTGDQLKLLWRMSAEPVLCFDGDEAGQKAAYRALDTALPMLAPGYSLRFVFLPSGQDPDDVIRGEGAGAFERLLAEARPLADVLWGREAGGGNWETPERRAALEARIETLLGELTDPKIRHHYQLDLRSRLAEFWSSRRGAAQRFGRSGLAGGRAGGSAGWRGTAGRAGWSGAGFAATPVTASESLKRSGLVAGHAARPPMREGILLMTLLNHPWLLDLHPEEIAALEFESRSLANLRNAMLALHATDGSLDFQEIRSQLSQNGLGAMVSQVERAVTHKSDWFAQPEASREDVEAGWRQISALHHKSLELERELEVAERAFQAEGTEESYARLRDIRLQLLNGDGTEAAAETRAPDSGRFG